MSGHPFADPNGECLTSGQSYVVFGKADGTAVELADIAAGQGGFALNGAAEGDYSGVSVSGAGDVNGDGSADLIVGASGADPNGDTSARATWCSAATSSLAEAAGCSAAPALELLASRQFTAWLAEQRLRPCCTDRCGWPRGAPSAQEAGTGASGTVCAPPTATRN